MSARHPYLDHDGVAAFAHRGGTSEWPENTMPAFQHAIDLGYRYLETDVHPSADGVLYAYHDANLQARTGLNANIADLTASEIDELTVDGRARIPRFDEVLLTWPNARVNIDPKSDAAVLPLVRTLARYDVLDRVCVGSFSDRRIKLCRSELGPDLCTSMGTFEIGRLLLASYGLADASRLVALCAQVPVRSIVPITTTAFIETAHTHNIDVHVWTIDDPDQMRRLVELGVNGIMTDRPLTLRDVLIDCDVWRPQPVATMDLTRERT